MGARGRLIVCDGEVEGLVVVMVLGQVRVVMVRCPVRVLHETISRGLGRHTNLALLWLRTLL